MSTQPFFPAIGFQLPTERLPQEGPASTFRWATVTQLVPLRVRLDGETAALTTTPQTLIDPAMMAVNDRVWVQLFGLRVLVLGVYGGFDVPAPFSPKVLRVSALDTSSVSAGWVNLDWTGTTVVNEDTWTLSGDGNYWTCPVAGTYSILVRINCSGSTAMRVEMDAESTSDGLVRVMGIASHDYVGTSIPSIRMSVDDTILVKFDPGASNTVTDDSLLLVTRIG